MSLARATYKLEEEDNVMVRMGGGIVLVHNCGGCCILGSCYRSASSLCNGVHSPGLSPTLLIGLKETTALGPNPTGGRFFSGLRSYCKKIAHNIILNIFYNISRLMH
jgi:hypothetical protein